MKYLRYVTANGQNWLRLSWSQIMCFPMQHTHTPTDTFVTKWRRCWCSWSNYFSRFSKKQLQVQSWINDLHFRWHVHLTSFLHVSLFCEDVCNRCRTREKVILYLKDLRWENKNLMMLLELTNRLNFRQKIYQIIGRHDNQWSKHLRQQVNKQEKTDFVFLEHFLNSILQGPKVTVL